MEKFYNISNEDRELYNLYKRMTDSELKGLSCPDNICNLVKFERFENKGDYNKFNGSINNILPILASFPDYTTALAFVESFKPGFRYSPYFKDFIESRMEVIEKENKTIYVLGDYKYVKYDNKEKWYYKGKLHREDGPAVIEYDDGIVNIESYYLNGKLHRENEPAVIEYRRDSTIRRVEYLQNGEHYRKDGPTYIEYYYNGQASLEHYYVNEELERTDGPAMIRYNQDGSIRTEGYYLKGKLHRMNGPAEIIYGPDGDIESTKIYIDGREIHHNYRSNNGRFINGQFAFGV